MLSEYHYFLLGLVLLSFSVIADTNKKNNAQIIKDLIPLSMDKLFDIKTILASKSLETVFNAPSSMTVFSQKELQAMGLHSVEELLNLVPGFFSSQEVVMGAGSMIAARGRTSPQASYNILVMIDGERLNTETSGGAFSINNDIPLQNVKQVEIIRGPGSALYGTSAFLGVVNIVTNNSTNQAFIKMGQADYREASIQVAKHQGDFNLSLFVRYFQDNGESFPTYLLSSDARKGADISFSLGYQPFVFKLRHTQRETAHPHLPATQEIPNYSNSAQTNAYVEYQSPKTLNANWSLRLGYMQGSRNVLRMDSVAQHNNLRDYLYHPQLSVEELKQVALLSGLDTKESAWHIDWDAHYFLSPKHELFAGLTWRSSQNDKFRSQSNFDYDSSLRIAHNNETLPVAYYGEVIQQGVEVEEIGRDVLGMYVQTKHILSQHVLATLGARYDKYSDFGHSVNPRLAVLYSPISSTQFKLMYGEAFRAPSLRQVASRSLGNSNLKAEKIKTAELAWLQTYSYNNLQTALTYFHNWHSDLIDTVTVSEEQFSRQFSNLPNRIETSGWELEVSSKLTKNLSMRLAYDYMQKTEEHPRRYPRQQLAVILNYYFKQWNINLRSQFHDSVEYDFNQTNRIELKSYWRLDTHIRYQLNNNLYLVGSVNNLLNEDYYSSSKVFGLPAGLPNRGRAAYLGVEIPF